MKDMMEYKGHFGSVHYSDLHRRAAISAQQQGVNLNRLVTDALEHYLRG